MIPVRSAPELAPSLGLEPLMSAYQQADENAATALIERVSPLLLRYFLVQPASRRFADDLLQETWMRIHKARHTYRAGEPVLPWMFAIARHAGLDGWRRNRRVEIREMQVDVLPQAAAPDPESTPRDLDLEALLAALPESQREVIVMLKISGMSIEEVARATSATAGSVKQKAHRAYLRLRQVLSTKRGANEA
jgi:RNA polymerase sigma-70 factor (ECF subfamily)